MIEFKITKNNRIKLTDVGHLHGYGAMCARCYEELKFSNGPSIWVYCQLDGREKDDYIKLPCGCIIKAEDVNASLIFVDEWIVPYVSKMNMAGYRTKFSCSGHVGRYNDGYIIFAEAYEDLADYIAHHPRLLEVIDLEYSYSEKKDLIITKYNRDVKRYKTVSVSNGCTVDDIENISIRMKPGYKIGNSNRSRFEKLGMFRKVLNEISKWCWESRLYRDRQKLKLGVKE